MNEDDAARWEDRYRSDPHWSGPNPPRAFLVEHAASLPANGLALDAAMGPGGSAGYLLARGLKVIGVDRALTAVRQTKMRYPELWAVQADLRRFYLPSGRFDVILNFYYLERSLFARYVTALRPGGILFFETMTIDMREVRPEINPDHLLQPGELREAFGELEILDYREGWEGTTGGRKRARAALLGRKS